jgi:hypothetical protein
VKDFQSLILKSGMQHLIQKNEPMFKKSLIDVLSFKLNENINFLTLQTNKSLLHSKYKSTELTENMKLFIEFLESYDPKTNTKLKLKNDSVINITEQEITEIKSLFNQLSPKNRQKMAETIFENKNSLDQHLEFYGKTKVLIK